MRRRSRGRARRFGITALVAVPLSTLIVALSSVESAAVRGELTIRVLSGRPDMVTAGDALLRVDVSKGVPLPSVTVWLNGKDVTDAFAVDDSTRTLTGYVTGFRNGRNRVVATTSKQEDVQATLSVVNYPVEGPVSTLR